MKSDTQNKKVGSVLVVGGGIGGIQASLDLADSGFKVYLLESTPAIGGTMAQLDKTFPTGDCAMCMISPKLVECGRHFNIEIITYADVERIDGVAGNFKVQVKKRARYVDESKCNGCGDCEKACPVEIENNFDERLAERKAIYRLYPQAIPNIYTITKKGTSPCRLGCPAGVNAHAYVALISQKKFKEALDVVRTILPFPSVCGRVCHHPCEGECNRKDIDEPIAIRPLKRFISDWVRDRNEEPPTPIVPDKNDKIAIIGAGPAGLTCGIRLLELGYPVTVFDSASEPGGMVTSCLPEYRIPKADAQYDIDRLLAYGLNVKTNTRIGKDISLDEIKKEYQAVFIAIGSQDPAKLPVPGAELKGVLYGLPFLRDAKVGRKPDGFGSKIIVIGGGNVGIDCAKTALRLGAKEVNLVCLETRDLTSPDKMPAHFWEIEEAEEEGVKIFGSLGPQEIVGTNGQVTGLRVMRCVSVCNEQRKFSPKFSDESVPSFEADTIIIAIGQRSNLTGFEGLEAIRGAIKTDKTTLETNITGIFAGGDIARGPASVIEAVADGNEASISIDRYLNKQDLKEGRGVKSESAPLPERKIDKVKRAAVSKQSVEKRSNSFDEVELGWDEEKAVVEASRCLACAVCSECLECVKACKPQAIDHQMIDKTMELKTGAIVLSPGLDRFDAGLKGEYGYGRYPNVITSIQFERILSASGPYRGEISRPADRKHPRKIAFIQCVGSRDMGAGNGYCSAVCCMYATKQAIVAKEHDKNIQSTIFYIDMRTYGKGFERYWQRGQDEYGIKYVRCMISNIKEVPQTQNLKLEYTTSEGESTQQEEFDLVVLSVGLVPQASTVALAKRLGLQLNKYGFCQTNTFSPNQTNLPGILVAGTFQGPKDIPETVMQGSAVAGGVSELIYEARGSEVHPKAYTEETDIQGQEPRIGIFVCHCGINISATVDVPSVVKYASKLPNVVCVEEVLYACSQDNQENIKQKIKDLKLNRVIVASCTPRTHEPLFQETIREAGLNKHLFEMANIREQCSWVHSQTPAEATQKAKSLVAMTWAKARLLAPLRSTAISVTPKALVIGGGLAGMTASLSLARQGFEVHLVEKEKELGGNLAHLYYTLRGEDVPGYLKSLIGQVEAHQLIKTYKNSEVKEVQGYVGNFTTTLTADQKVEHGIIIVATGGQEYKPTEYLYGYDDRILTQRELEEMTATNILGLTPQTSIVMIQCVGSREPAHFYCSRVCCSEAIKNALKVKELNPQVAIYILYRDIRTYSFKEDYYRQAREKGVVFIRYEEDRKPEVKKESDGRLRVTVFDQLLRKEIVINPDKVILSAGILSAPGNKGLSEALKVPCDEDGFFLEAHVKLRPVDFANEGIFLCGLAHSPKNIDETISQAMAVVGRAGRILSRSQLEVEGVVSVIDPDKCAACLTCLRVCPYDAPFINEEGKAEIKAVKCQGCGICAGECPAKAIQLQKFRDEQLIAMIKAFSRYNKKVGV